MNYRKLGRYGIRVSEVALGGWLTLGRTLDDRASDAVVHKALEVGINFFDTADVYHQGEGEKALGKALKSQRRESVVIATKCYFPFGEGPNDRGLSRKHIFESLHNSLKRLNTDYVDLYQFHRFDEETPVDESIRAVDDLIRQGKVLYWGVSEWSAQQIRNAVDLADRLNANPPASNQPIYHMLNRYIEDEVLPTSEKLGMGQVVFSPLAQGVLTGKYLPGQPPPTGTRGADESSNMFMGNLLKDEVLTRVQKLKGYLEGQGLQLAPFALAWCLRQRGVSSVIIGASRPEQVAINAQASGLSVEESVFKAAEDILAGESTH